MDPTRSKQIDSLFRAALALDGGARAAFLDQACAGDPGLRRAVESLLSEEQTVCLSIHSTPGEEPELRFGPYRNACLIGKGGMGEVFRAHDPKLGRDVAIKTLPARFAADEAWLARFQREARMLAALNHPNIAVIHSLEEDSGVHFLVMELVGGETLADRLAAQGRLLLPEVLDICSQVAAALEAAHGKSIVHRDIKPANIKVAPGGLVKVLDFGLAKTVESAAPGQDETLSLGVTGPGAFVGTPPYMSPEQLRGGPVDHRTDIWAFGCLLFELLSGRRAFEGSSATEAIAKVLESDPSWSNLPPNTPGYVRKLIESCLQKDPQRRPPAFAQLRTMLAPPPRAARLPARRYLIAAAASTIAIAGPLAYLLLRNPDRPVEILAVLPFLNATGNPDSDYIGRGLCDSLITALSQAPGLKVVSRDSVSRFAGMDPDARKAGAELGASAVLKGRISRRDGAMHIAAELVRTADGFLLWNGQFSRAGENVLATEQSLSREVLQRLRIPLSDKDRQRLASLSTSNPDAHRLYLQGRFYWSTRSEENLQLSAASFQKAIQLDPGFALAWAGLADAYLMLGGWGVLEPRDVYPRARAAAERAIAIDGNIAEPHATLAYLKTLYEWDWAGSRQEFQRAIELNPNYGTAHHWYAFYFMTLGDMRNALAEIERAREVDPLSPVISAEVGYFYSFDRQYDRAIAEARKSLALDPESVYSRLSLANLLARQGQHEEAVAQINSLPPADRLGPVLLMNAIHVRAKAGQRDAARAELRVLMELARKRYVMPALIAGAYSCLGENDKALDYFERSIDDRSLVASWLREPELDPLRSSPRFLALFARLGLNP